MPTLLFATSYDSVEIFALPFVTLTPNCFARATISMRFLDETECAMLFGIGQSLNYKTDSLELSYTAA